MKVKVLFCGLMCCATTVVAQSEVRLYGTIDAGIGYESVEGNFLGEPVDARQGGLTTGVNSPNSIGLRGKEQLWEDLFLRFHLEAGFSALTGEGGTGRLFNRYATVGLHSLRWGSVDFGRQINAASWYLTDIIGPFGADFSHAALGRLFGAVNSPRYDNMVLYQTNWLGPWRFALGYSFNTAGEQQFDRGGDSEDTRALTTAIRYESGRFAAGVSYDRLRSRESLPGGRGGIVLESWNIGAKYDFRLATLHGGVGQTSNGWFSTFDYGPLSSSGRDLGDGFIVLEGLRINSYTAGVGIPIGGQGRVMVSWGIADPVRAGHFTGRDPKAQQVYSLGYTYALSPRTNFYTAAAYTRHVAFHRDLTAHWFAVGFLHRF